MTQASKVTFVDGGKVEILTSRLLLRGARENDAHSLHEAFSDPEVMRYWYVGFTVSSLPLVKVPTGITSNECCTWTHRYAAGALPHIGPRRKHRNGY